MHIKDGRRIRMPPESPPLSTKSTPAASMSVQVRRREPAVSTAAGVRHDDGFGVERRIGHAGIQRQAAQEGECNELKDELAGLADDYRKGRAKAEKRKR
ncbi:MAG: hypothetical protein ACK4NA_10935 [Alphaproteobacteria bacterium]